MKKTLTLVILLQLTLLFNSCSSDSENNSEELSPQDKYVTIQSYSKNYGTTGDTITITGEKFSTKISEIKITFDGVAATILSATATEIKFILPATEKLLPKLALTIENRTVTNSVKNNYDKNIGVLPMPPKDAWFTIENKLKSGSEIQRIKMLSDKIIYYVMDAWAGPVTYRSLDGGISWVSWATNGFFGGFHATKNDEGWSGSLDLLVKIPIGGDYLRLNFIMEKIGEPTSLYVDENMTTGTFITNRGDVYTTNDGLVFSKIYTSGINNPVSGQLSRSAEIDNDHMWAIGYKAKGYLRPFIVYKNHPLGDWKDYSFDNEPDYSPREICFVDQSTGFLLIRKYYQVLLDVKLYKTTDGGDTWLPLYNGEKFTKFAFKDSMTGWAILDNKIYKTTNGGSEWVLDYTHDQPIRGIAYKNNVVWAISNDKILKRYL